MMPDFLSRSAAMTDLTLEKTQAAAAFANRLFFRFFQAVNMLHTKGTQALESLGVTTQQWSVLGALSRPHAESGMSVGDLSRYLLGRPKRDERIERATDAEDRRSRKVEVPEQMPHLASGKLQKFKRREMAEALRQYPAERAVGCGATASSLRETLICSKRPDADNTLTCGALAKTTAVSLSPAPQSPSFNTPSGETYEFEFGFSFAARKSS